MGDNYRRLHYIKTVYDEKPICKEPNAWRVTTKPARVTCKECNAKLPQPTEVKEP